MLNPHSIITVHLLLVYASNNYLFFFLCKNYTMLRTVIVWTLSLFVGGGLIPLLIRKIVRMPKKPKSYNEDRNEANFDESFDEPIEIPPKPKIVPKLTDILAMPLYGNITLQKVLETYVKNKSEALTQKLENDFGKITTTDREKRITMFVLFAARILAKYHKIPVKALKDKTTQKPIIDCVKQLLEWSKFEFPADVKGFESWLTLLLAETH